MAESAHVSAAGESSDSSEGQPHSRTSHIPAAAAAEEAAAPECYSVGPLSREWEVRAVLSALRGAGLAAQRRSAQRKEPRSYWVYLPAAETQVQTETTLQELDRRGVRDHAMYGAGEKKNAISLGLYRNESAAQRRIAELNDKGFEPLMEIRYDTKEVYSVEYQLPAGASGTDRPRPESLLRNLGFAVPIEACGVAERGSSAEDEMLDTPGPSHLAAPSPAP